MITVRERYNLAKRDGDLEFVAMIELAVENGILNWQDRWDVDEESVLNWWEEFKEKLRKEGKEVRCFYGEGTWMITQI